MTTLMIFFPYNTLTITWGLCRLLRHPLGKLTFTAEGKHLNIIAV
jgi:hypothetical protein